jgi:hypothetical protein
LYSRLRGLEEQWGRDPEDKLLSIRFEKLIKQACIQTGKKVVVLIDEYDKPLTNTMEDEETHIQIRKVLKGFYGVLKSSDAFLRFVMLTGVTKFSQISVFSDLNHLSDITLSKQYAGICGISESELLAVFQPELHALADETESSYEETLAEMKKRYDGYHFCENSEGMYNPFSVLNTLSSLRFRNYWFKTGTPTFLVNMLKQGGFNIQSMEKDITILADSINDYRPESADPVPILYQTGYLTIKGYKKQFDA